jgi:biotin carboxylase
MRQKILILGGSRDQYATLKAVNGLNLTSIIVDSNINCYCKDKCDYFLHISTRNPELIIKELEKFNIKPDKIIVQGTDIPHIAALIANYFKISYISEEAAKLSIDKLEIKNFLKTNGFLVPSISKVIKIEDALAFVELYKYPVVIKPNFKSGSLGVFYIENEETLIKCFLQTFNSTDLDYILIEKYIQGTQISSESILNHCKSYTYGLAERNYDKLSFTKPYIIENGGIQPFIYWKVYYNKINELIQKIANLLEINNGFIKGDLIIDEYGDIYIIELATRLSGGDFCETLIPKSLGFDYMELCVLSTLEKIEIFPSVNFINYTSNKYFFPEKEGLVEEIIIDDQIYNSDWLLKIEFFYDKGDYYKMPISHGNRFGVFVVSGKSIEDLKYKIDLVYNSVKINIK